MPRVMEIRIEIPVPDDEFEAAPVLVATKARLERMLGDIPETWAMAHSMRAVRAAKKPRQPRKSKTAPALVEAAD